MDSEIGGRRCHPLPSSESSVGLGACYTVIKCGNRWKIK